MALSVCSPDPHFEFCRRLTFSYRDVQAFASITRESIREMWVRYHQHATPP